MKREISDLPSWSSRIGCYSHSFNTDLLSSFFMPGTDCTSKCIFQGKHRKNSPKYRTCTLQTRVCRCWQCPSGWLHLKHQDFKNLNKNHCEQDNASSQKKHSKCCSSSLKMLDPNSSQILPTTLSYNAPGLCLWLPRKHVFHCL